MKKSSRFPRPACNHVDGYTVVCQNPDCIGYGADSWYERSEKRAEERWNTRHERTCHVVNGLEPYCSECGEVIGADQPYCSGCGAKVARR